MEVDRQNSAGHGLKKLAEQVKKVITYNTVVNEDWMACVEKLKQSATALKTCSPKDKNQDIDEALAFLNWLEDDNFLFLGCREYELAKDQEPGGLKLSRGSGRGIFTG